MAAKAPAKKAAPKKAKTVKASKAKAKTKYSPAQQKAYTAASRAAVVKARGLANIQGVQSRRGLAAVRSKARPGRSGKRLKPVHGIQAVIRNKVLAAQAAGYAKKTQVYTYQQAAFISGVATARANRKAIARVLARKKLKKPAHKVTKATAAPKRRPGRFSAIGARAGAAAAARVPKPKPVAAKPKSKTRKAAGGRHETLADTQWIVAGNDKGVENCVAVAVANHLLLHTGCRVDKKEITCLLYRDSVAKALYLVDYQNPWKGVGLSEYGMVSPEEAQPGDIVGFETSQGSHCGVLMPGNMVISWGEIVPLESEVDEAWQVTWTTSR